MESLTVLLLERIGLLLIIAFLITRISSFRRLLNRELDGKTIIYQSLIFGIFGIAGAQAGVVIDHDIVSSHLWLLHLGEQEMLVGSSLVAIVIAGLLGGPIVGVGSGIIVAGFLFFLGGVGVLASVLVNPLAGLLAGLTARFFSNERVIAPEKAFFIGMFAPILHMSLLLILTNNPDETILLVNRIGIPLVFSSSIAIAVFTTMLHVILKETDQEVAFETGRALKIVDQALPYLKNGFSQDEDSAWEIAKLLQKELKISAASITNQKYVLAHAGLGSDHHMEGQMLLTDLSKKALELGGIQIAYHSDEIQCRKRGCPLQAAIIIPITQSSEIIGLIKLYFNKPQQIRSVEIALAKGLGKLISNQLDMMVIENMKQHLQEAELRNLQAQINPHFLFNTLHLIDTLIRVDPILARHLIVQLSTFMRFNFKIASVPLIPIEQEIMHVKAYLEIVNVRFSDQLHVTIDVPNHLLNTDIPPFTLQPLIENSLKHGLHDVESGGEVGVQISQVRAEIEVVVTDNGSGISADLLEKLGQETVTSNEGNGTGLYNVNQRLISLLGNGSHLYFENQDRGGSRIFFSLPIKNKGEKPHEIQDFDCRG